MFTLETVILINFLFDTVCVKFSKNFCRVISYLAKMPLIEEIDCEIDSSAAAVLQPKAVSKPLHGERLESLELGVVEPGRGDGDTGKNDSSLIFGVQKFKVNDKEDVVEDGGATFGIFGGNKQVGQRKVMIEELENQEFTCSGAEQLMTMPEESHKTLKVSTASAEIINPSDKLVIEDMTDSSATSCGIDSQTVAENSEDASSQPNETKTGLSADLSKTESFHEVIGSDSENGNEKKSKREIRPRRILTEEELNKYPRYATNEEYLASSNFEPSR